jgi:hypothetical protein
MTMKIPDLKSDVAKVRKSGGLSTRLQPVGTYPADQIG